MLLLELGASAERPPSGDHSHVASNALLLELGTPEPSNGADGKNPRLAYSSMSSKDEELSKITASYREKATATQQEADKAKQQSDDYLGTLKSLQAGHVTLNVGMGELKKLLETQGKQSMGTLRQVLGSAVALNGTSGNVTAANSTA
mmetsp:Transcript_47613/g.110290  ORF Transcript_47613/g.110290 Transcript_47613/m.110290 type:complete len:147 (-) Transcript_47613:122-562(-)